MRRVSFRRLVRFEGLIWVLLLLGLVAFRWPILKGWYYRAAHVAAPDSAIAWRTDLDAALTESSRTGRPVLVDFNASWCPPCIAMKHDVWTDPAVEAAVTKAFIPVAVDVDHDPGTSDRFGVDAIPAVLVLNAKGEVMHRAGFMTPSDVIRLADRHRGS